MIDDYSPITDSIIRRMSRRITVRPQSDPRHPYLAYVALTDEPHHVAPGHPRALTFAAATPAAAICGLVDLISTWLTHPRSSILLLGGPTGQRRAPGLEPVDAEVDAAGIQ